MFLKNFLRFSFDPQNIIKKHQRFMQKNCWALLICFSAFIFWVAFLTYKYLSFSYYDWDLALFSNLMWNLTQGRVENSLMGTSFLASHSHYVAFLTSPIFFLFQHPLTLVYLKVFSFTAGSFVFYKIAQERLGVFSAIALLAIYLTYPPNLFAMFFEFHFENFAMFLFFIMFYLFFKGRLTSFLAVAFLTSLIKENMPLVITMFGFYGLIVKKERKVLWGVVPIVIGLVMFYLSVFILIPYFRTGLDAPHAYLSQYSPFGKDVNKDVFSLAVQFPLQFVKLIFRSINIEFLCRLFAPLTISFLSPLILLIPLPLLLQSFLSTGIPQHTIHFHYAASIVPFIFISTVFAFKRTRDKLSRRLYFSVLAVFFILSMCNFMQYSDYYQNEIKFSQGKEMIFHDEFYKRFQHPDFIPDMNRLKNDILLEVPSQASIVATFEFLPYLSTREKIYSFHNIVEGRNPITGERPFVIPQQPEYALINFDDRWLLFLGSKREYTRVYRFLEEGWRIEQVFNNLVFLRKNKQSREKLVEVSKDSFLSNLNLLNRFAAPGLLLNAVDIGIFNEKENILPLVFYWNASQDLENFYGMMIFFEKDGQRIFLPFRDIGYGIWPTGMWEKGDFVNEKVWMVLPDLEPGEYNLKALIFVNKKRNKAFGILTSEDKKNSKFVVELGKIQIQ